MASTEMLHRKGSDEEDIIQGARRAVTEKLGLLKSPVVEGDNSGDEGTTPLGEPLPDSSQSGQRQGRMKEMPEFKRHEDASLLELFFDLFFAANYTVFSQTQSMTSREAIAAYVGYFTVLWISWFLVGLYDVRFVTDSWFERAARGIHLGVMVGFAVVAPDFDPSDQNARTMRTMSLILMVSRLCLAIEYAGILWHIRHFKKARLPLCIQIATSIVPALIYLGIAFNFDEGGSHAFVTWYVVAGLEAIATLVLSNFWEVLNFTRTHLMRRMSLLTVIILGDGIIAVAQNVVKIVEGPHAWNSKIIGIITAAIATVYIIFLVYFDWMKYTHLPAWRQQLWAGLHFFYHLALTVFMTAFTEFIIWTKITDVRSQIDPAKMLNMADWPSATSEDVSNHISNFTKEYFKQYPPTWAEAWKTVDIATANVTKISDDFWPTLYDAFATRDFSQVDTDERFSFERDLQAIATTMANSLFQTFGINVDEELREKSQDDSGNDIFSASFQSENFNEVMERHELIFALGYIAAGVSLFLMTLLTMTSHFGRWRSWSLIRTILMVVLSLALGSVSVLYYNYNHTQKYLDSPWLLPTITLAWLIVLALAHAHHFPDPRKGRKGGGNVSFSWSKAYHAVKGRRFRRRTYEPADNGTVVVLEERGDPENVGNGHRRLTNRNPFYDHAGFDEKGYQQPTADETSYEPYRQQTWEQSRSAITSDNPSK